MFINENDIAIHTSKNHKEKINVLTGLPKRIGPFYYIRIEHVPTGIVEQGESEHEDILKVELLKRLYEKVHENG